jgi:hypothetical protein
VENELKSVIENEELRVKSDGFRVMSLRVRWQSEFLPPCAMRLALCILRSERQQLEAHYFRISQHDIHILDGFAGSALDQIVNHRDNNGPTA